MVLLEGKNVSKNFGGIQALSRVGFHFEEGEVLGLIGPNGSGKTTLINLISGVYPVSEGEIYFKGKKISGLKPYRIARMGVARTYQIVKPFTRLSIEENVLIGNLFGKSHGQTSVQVAKKKVQEVLEVVGLNGMKDTVAENLTLTGRKRLELAKALANDPEILFLDEVMAGLSLSEMDEALELIRSINQRGVTIVVVEHVMRAIMSISHRIIVLHHGEKIATGPPEEIVSNDTVIAAYLGKKYAEMKRRGDAVLLS